MISIGDKLISDDVVNTQFVCHLESCKGACCWKGDFGAPLEDAEIESIKANLHLIKPYLEEQGINNIESNGIFDLYGKENFKGTVLNIDGSCAFLNRENEQARCGIELANKNGDIDFLKPISCHLYPIRVMVDPHTNIHLINYDKWDICNAACSYGEKLQVKVFEFAKDAIIRKYGESFYEQLRATAEYMDEP